MNIDNIVWKVSTDLLNKKVYMNKLDCFNDFEFDKYVISTIKQIELVECKRYNSDHSLALNHFKVIITLADNEQYEYPTIESASDICFLEKDFEYENAADYLKAVFRQHEINK